MLWPISGWLRLGGPGVGGACRTPAAFASPFTTQATAPSPPSGLSTQQVPNKGSLNSVLGCWCSWLADLPTGDESTCWELGGSPVRVSTVSL